MVNDPVAWDCPGFSTSWFHLLENSSVSGKPEWLVAHLEYSNEAISLDGLQLT